MSTNIFEKWNSKVDVEGLKKDAKEVKENGGGNFKEVAVGKYEVKVEKIELKESKKGDPMLYIQFKILKDEYKNSSIFYYQVLTTGFGLHNANEMLRSLDSGIEVKFDNFTQYNDLILDIHESIDDKLEYVLDYGKNNKDFNTYKIEDVFETE